MATQKEPPLVPHINTPPRSDSPVARVASPDSDYFPVFGTRTPARSASPASLSNLPTTPVALLRTPPIESQPPSRSRSKVDNQAESLTRNARSNARMTRTTSQSDNFSATLSPSIASHSSGGGSVHSSELGYSLNSLSSSEQLLTPPLFQADCDKRPYKPRRKSKDSLTMMKPKRAKKVSRDKLRKSKRQHQQKNNCHHGSGRSHKHQNSEHWWLPGCAIAPAAEKGMKELCEGHVGRYRPFKSTRGNTDTYGRVLPRLWSDPAPPLITRRWSSVEIGSHQIHPPSKFLQRSAVSTPGSVHHIDAESIPHRLGQRHRSSTFTQGAIDHDIVRIIRQTLTFRKVPSTDFQTPTTITLRRASGASTRSGVGTITGMITPKVDCDIGGTTPLAYSRSQDNQDFDTAYLITHKDIDSVTELIEANLQRNYRPHNRARVHPLVTHTSVQASRLPNFTLKGTIPKIVPATESAATVAQDESIITQPQDSLSHLQVTSPCQKKTGILPRSASMKSAHEVIWEVNEFSNSSRGEDFHRLSSTSEGEETAVAAPQNQEFEAPQLPLLRIDKGDAFDPNNAKDSISEWSWKLTQADVPLIVTSSDSESDDLIPPSGAPPRPRSRHLMRSTASTPDVSKKPVKVKSTSFRRPVGSVGSVSEIPDVVSFPALPRKETNDWFSPLPDIVAPLPRVSITRSLYDEGIDATGAPAIKAPKLQRHNSFLMNDRSTSPSPSIKFDPEYDIRCRSLVKAAFLSPARFGSESSMGSSIGAYSGERRKSLFNTGLKHVHTIDNIHKGEREGTWTRNRPPSVCPIPKAPSPIEFEDNNDTLRAKIQPQTSRSGAVARLSSLRDRGPPLTKVDRVGIYGMITGTLKSAFGLDDCPDECPPHACDDCANDPRNPSVDWIG